MPNSSGGAVVRSTRLLAGLHTGTVYHLEELPSSSCCSSSSSVEAPAELELDPTSMWEDPDEVDAVEAAAADDSMAAQLSRINIQHKSSAAMFVPAAALIRFLQAVHLQRSDGMDVASRTVARRQRPRRW